MWQVQAVCHDIVILNGGLWQNVNVCTIHADNVTERGMPVMILKVSRVTGISQTFCTLPYLKLIYILPSTTNHFH